MALNKKNQLSASAYYQTTTPSISLRSNDIVQSNELMYMTGNPDLHNVRNLDLNLAYNFVHSNALSVSFFTGYKEDFDKVTTIYRPFKEGTALLRDFVNEGDYMRFFFGAAVNCKLFENSLQLYANINQNFYHTSGMYIMDLRPIKIQLQATYYWKSFSAQAYWVNRDEKLTENSNIVIRGRDSYGLSLGWGNGMWNVNLSARNIFRRGWRSSTWDRDTPLYKEIQTYYNPSVHANLNMSVTYTIGYGKKIRRGDEIRGEGDNGPSAILK